MCVFYDGSIRKSTPIVVLVKTGIEPATPGSQGIALIHYTTAMSLIDSIKQEYTYHIYLSFDFKTKKNEIAFWHEKVELLSLCTHLCYRLH